jgi:hypothetical protein
MGWSDAAHRGLVVVVAVFACWLVQTGAAAADSPAASVTVTAFSPTVSGNIGENVAGVGVTVSLVRSGTTVATATATTSGSGDWTATLVSTVGSAHGFAPGGSDPLAFGGADSLAVHYEPPAASPSTAVPPDLSSGFGFARNAHIAHDGSAVVGLDNRTTPDPQGQPCPGLRFIVNGTVEVPTFVHFHECQYTPPSPLGDSDDVQAQSATTVGSSTLFAVDDLGLPGFGAIPTCDADLVTGHVTCRRLDTGQFTISHNGGPGQALPTTLRPGPAQEYDGSATVSGLRPGDTLTLRETAPASRVLTTLHVRTLQVRMSAGTTVGGTCDPADWTQFGVCPSTGQLPTAPPGGSGVVLDDLSGGHITATIGSLTNMVPADNASVSSAGFLSFVDLTGFSSTSAALAQTSSVRLALAPYPSGATVYAHDMQLQRSGGRAYASLAVTSIPARRYTATWTLTDINGDTNQFQTLVVAQPSAVLPPSQTGGKHQGVPSVTEPTTGKVCWSVRVKARRHARAHTCREVEVPAGASTISVSIRRGHRLLAQGSGAWHGSTLSLKLFSSHRLARRRYLVTVTAHVGKGSTTLLHRRLRIG